MREIEPGKVASERGIGLEGERDFGCWENEREMGSGALSLAALGGRGTRGRGARGIEGHGGLGRA